MGRQGQGQTKSLEAREQALSRLKIHLKIFLLNFVAGYVLQKSGSLLVLTPFWQAMAQV